MKKLHKLTALSVSKLQDKGAYGDGGGLYFQIAKNGSRSWIFRYMRNGRTRKMGLGALHTISLAEARERARVARSMLLDGIDPLEAKHSKRKAERLEAARVITFRQCGEQFIAAQERGWRNVKHRAQWFSTLEKYVYPTAGDLPVQDIDVAIVCKILDPIWPAKTDTAARLRGRIESILDWAKARGYRSGENPARWRGHLEKVYPHKNKIAKTEHRKALPFADVPALMAELRASRLTGSAALEFTILTAARTNEALGATWNEFDLERQIWTVPGERMKSGRSHTVPLSRRTIDLLNSRPRTGRFVFPGRFGDGPLSNMAMLQLLRDLRPGGYTVHGFRSAFRDWGAETTNFSNEVLEMALAHVVSDETEAAYRRGTLLEKRRALMEQWAAFCERGVVVPFRVA